MTIIYLLVILNVLERIFVTKFLIIYMKIVQLIEALPSVIS